MLLDVRALQDSVFNINEVVTKIHRALKAGFPLANIFVRSDFFTLSLSFRLKPSGTNYVETKEKKQQV